MTARARSTTARFRPIAEALESREVPSTTPYLVPTAPGVSFSTILTTGDTVGSYTMGGIPDGLGVFDNGDGTITVLMNHEFTTGDAIGVPHAHNASLLMDGNAATNPAGAYVDRLVVRKSDLAVLSGGDLIQSLVDAGTGNAVTGTALNLSRLCSADLAAVSAFYNEASGKGTTERLLLNGEEQNNGRALATVVTGPNAGTTYLLPAFNAFGGGSWENLLANPATGDTTLVIANSDNGTGNHLNKVIVYVGTKQDTGNEVERAGLTNGISTRSP